MWKNQGVPGMRGAEVKLEPPERVEDYVGCGQYAMLISSTNNLHLP